MSDYLKTYINRLKGISGTGGLLGEIQQSLKNPTTVLEPGDMVSTDVNGEIAKLISAPVAYDLWYLHHPLNMLSRWTETPDSIPEIFLTENLSFLADDLSGLKPMAFCRDLDSFIRNEYEYWIATGSMPRWEVFTEWFVHMMPFEFWPPDATAVHDSAGPSIDHGFVRDDYAGYVMFPVGQLGVMEVISLFGQTQSESDDFELTKELTPITESETEFFFSPIDLYTGLNHCLGNHLIESGYVVPQEKRKQIEWLSADHYKDQDIAPQSWLKHWIHKDDTFPVPGELMCALVKPTALPPHVWWYQKSSVYIHAGNWFETQHLTSGVVDEVTEEGDREPKGIGAEYKIKVHGINILAYASDFAKYEIGDRVALLKILSVKEELEDVSFAWTDVYAMEQMDEGRRTYDYLVVPFEFYK